MLPGVRCSSAACRNIPALYICLITDDRHTLVQVVGHHGLLGCAYKLFCRQPSHRHRRKMEHLVQIYIPLLLLVSSFCSSSHISMKPLMWSRWCRARSARPPCIYVSSCSALRLPRVVRRLPSPSPRNVLFFIHYCITLLLLSSAPACNLRGCARTCVHDLLVLALWCQQRGRKWNDGEKRREERKKTIADLMSLLTCCHCYRLSLIVCA